MQKLINQLREMGFRVDICCGIAQGHCFVSLTSPVYGKTYSQGEDIERLLHDVISKAWVLKKEPKPSNDERGG